MRKQIGSLLCLVVLLFYPAAPAARADTSEDCNAEDTGKKLAGCSALIAQGSLPAADLAIAYSRRSDAYLEAGQLDQAIADRAKALELQSADVGYKRRLSQIYQLRAEARQQKKNFDGALADYTEAVKADPFNHGALFERSNAHLALNNVDKAIDDVRAAAELGKSEAYPIWLAKLYDRRATEHLLKVNYDLAIADYTEAIRFDSANASLRMNRGSAYIAKNDIDAALKDYSEAILINADLTEAYLRRGQLFHAHGALARAVADLDEAIKRDETNVTALMLRGLAQEESKQAAKAVSDYRAVLTIEPAHKLAKASLERLERPGSAPPMLSSSNPVASPRKEAKLPKAEQEAATTGQARTEVKPGQQIGKSRTPSARGIARDPLKESHHYWPSYSIPTGQSVTTTTADGRRLTCIGGDRYGTPRRCRWN